MPLLKVRVYVIFTLLWDQSLQMVFICLVYLFCKTIPVLKSFIMAAENTEGGIPWCLISPDTELESYCSDSPSAEDSPPVWVVILDPRPLEVGSDLPVGWDKAFGSTSHHSKMRISISLYRIIVKYYYWTGSFFPTRGNISLLLQLQEQECHDFILLDWCGNC